MPHLTEEPETPRPTGSRRRITETERRRFAEVLDRTNSVKEAAQALGISLPTAYKLARTCGWEAPNAAESGASGQRGKLKTKYTQEQKNTFFKAFDRLQNVSAAAREVGFPAPHVPAMGNQSRGDYSCETRRQTRRVPQAQSRGKEQTRSSQHRWGAWTHGPGLGSRRAPFKRCEDLS